MPFTVMGIISPLLSVKNDWSAFEILQIRVGLGGLGVSEVSRGFTQKQQSQPACSKQHRHRRSHRGTHGHAHYATSQKRILSQSGSAHSVHILCEIYRLWLEGDRLSQRRFSTNNVSVTALIDSEVLHQLHHAYTAHAQHTHSTDRAQPNTIA